MQIIEVSGNDYTFDFTVPDGSRSNLASMLLALEQNRRTWILRRALKVVCRRLFGRYNVWLRIIMRQDGIIYDVMINPLGVAVHSTNDWRHESWRKN